MKKKVSPSHGNANFAWATFLTACAICAILGFEVMDDYRTDNHLGRFVAESHVGRFIAENSIFGSPAFAATVQKTPAADNNRLRRQLTVEATESHDDDANGTGVVQEYDLEDVGVTEIRERSELSKPLPTGYYILPSGREVLVTGHAPMHPLGLGATTDRFVKETARQKNGRHGLIDATAACNEPLRGEPKTYWLHLKPDKPRMINICVWMKNS